MTKCLKYLTKYYTFSTSALLEPSNVLKDAITVFSQYSKRITGKIFSLKLHEEAETNLNLDITEYHNTQNNGYRLRDLSLTLFLVTCELCDLGQVTKVISSIIRKMKAIVTSLLGCCISSLYYSEFSRETETIRTISIDTGEGNGNSLQYCSLRNPSDRGDWQAAVHVVAKNQIWLSD